jgi:SAM-dependent methyltransferase
MTNPTDYTEHWNTIYREAYASGKDFWRPEHATPRGFIEFLDSPLAPAPPARVLEAGCSDGLNCVYLARRGYAVTGVDVSEKAIARARHLAETEKADVEFILSDLASTSLGRPGEYDLWVDIKTLHCIWDDEPRQAYLRNAFESLKPGGVLFLTCGLALADLRDYFPELFETLDGETQASADTLDRDAPVEERSGIRCETLDWYCREIEQAGFTILEAAREASIESGWGATVIAQVR